MPNKKIKGVDSYTLRLYDKYDGYWIDIKSNISYAQALQLWDIKTSNGIEYASYKDGAYYEIFPSKTNMLFNGRE